MFRNLFWDVSGRPVGHDNPPGHDDYLHDGPDPRLPIEKWQAMGCDRHSIVADPKCRDLANFDFTLADDSPAFDLGFRPIDMSDVGPRPRK